MHEHYDVAVVGYGPTGLVAASLLGAAGHRVAVVERWPNLYGLPRFTHIDGEVARIIAAAADIGDALRDSGPTKLTFENGEGEVLIHVPAHVGGRSGHLDHMSIHQPDIEAALDKRVRSHLNVTVRSGTPVSGLEQDADGVTLALADGESLRASWVIGADGSRSTIRATLGVDRDDYGFHERWVNYDAEWLGEVPDRFRDTTQVCDPARGRMTMRIGERRQRFEFAVLEHEDTETMQTPERAWELLGEDYGVGPDDVRLMRRIVYTFEAKVAQQWRSGRVLLAGDAAHTMPPYMGQGACSGIRDAANLAWKLDLVLRGVAADELIDSYEVERRPHATALVHASIALGRVANESDPQVAARRDAAFRSGQVPPPPPMPTLTAGVLQRSDHGQAPAAGTLTPQPALLREARTARLDEIVGLGFLLVTRVDIDELLDVDQRRFLDQVPVRVVRLGVDVHDCEPPDEVASAAGSLRGYLDQLEADAYLARPDFVLFGAAAAPGIPALVEDLRSQLTTAALGRPPIAAGRSEGAAR